MALSEIQQATSLLTKSADTLLLVPEKASIDALASLIALYLALLEPARSEEQIIDAVSASHLPGSLQFLSGSSQVKTHPTEQPEIVLDLSTPAKVKGLRQEQLRGGTRLHISLPASLNLNREEIEVSLRPLPYGVVVVIGALDLEELGELFVRHADFFYNTPIINIDHRPANEQFGAINLVDITAASCAEITHDLITSLNPNTLTPDIATALYTGIVAGTDSFQKPTTNPRSFQTAATLIENNADRESVIQHLVKTKPLKIIKLTGAIYARLRYEDQVQLYWTTITPRDFQDSRATSADLPAAMHELTHNIAGYAAAFVLYETPSPPAGPVKHYAVYLLLGGGLASRRREIQTILDARKQNGALIFTFTAPSLETAEKIAHQKIREILP